MENTISSLPAKVAAASLDVGGKLSTDKRNTQQNYDYLSADKILSICGQALAQQGIIIFPDIASQDIVALDYTDQYGKPKTRHDCKVEFLFHICDGTSEMIQRWYGMGSDYAAPDKALYKAITSGHKYFLMKLMCVGAGEEDSEHEPSEEVKKPAAQPAKAAAPAQAKPAQEPAAPVLMPDDVTAACAWMNSKGVRYGDLDTPTLQIMVNSMAKANEKPETTDEQRAERAEKTAAARLIMAWRAQNK